MHRPALRTVRSTPVPPETLVRLRHQAEARDGAVLPRIAPPRPDDRQAARVGLKVASALSESRDWPGLIRALARRGLGCVLADDGLVLVEAVSGDPLCTADAVGAGYPVLVRRFGQRFPGDPLATSPVG